MIRASARCAVLAEVFLALWGWIAASSPARAADWPQGPGPHGSYQSEGPEPPSRWSVSTGENILWRQKLPECGQSGIAVVGDRVFLTVRNPLPDDAPNTTHYTTDVQGLCLDARTGKILWEVLVPGRKSHTYVDMFMADPTPVASDTHVWFANPSGGLMCLDHGGKEIWRRVFDVEPLHNAKVCQPQMVDGKLFNVALKDPLPPPGDNTKEKIGKNSGLGPWSYLQAFEPMTGRLLWTAEDATSFFSAPGYLKRGREWVVFHGRGGSHNPPEKPYGFSLTSMETGKTIWNSPLEDGCVYFPSHFDERYAYVFGRNKLLALDLKTGRIERSTPLSEKFDWYRYNANKQTTELAAEAKSPLGAHPTNHASILVGRHVLYMAHNHPSLGRVNVDSGKVEYLQVPYQVVRKPQAGDQTLWDRHIESLPTNSRGMSVSGDKRELGNGWGHVMAPAPIAVNGKVYFVTMIGTVYVADAESPKFDSGALRWVGDLGPAGETWTLASLSYANGRLYGRTLKEVVCIGK